MRKITLTVLLVLAMVTLAQAAGTYTDDFEAYTAFAATANNGNLWFNDTSAAADGSYGAAGWMSAVSWGGPAIDDLQISAAGGPHGAGNPSGYGDTLGLTNFDGTNAHGIAMALPSSVDLAGGDTVELSIKINASAQAAPGNSALYVGSSYLVQSAPPNATSGFTISSTGSGNMKQNPLGAEPAHSGIPEAAAGWAQVKLVISSQYSEGYEYDVTTMEIFAGPIGGSLTSRGSYGNNQLYNPTHFSLHPNLGTTYDDLSVVVTPEPATMILLGLGGLLIRLKK